MADYEFQESEVIFSMDNLDFETCLDFRRHHQNDKSNLSKKKKMGNVNNNNNNNNNNTNTNNNNSNNNIIKSVPVKIPDNIFDRFSGSEDDSYGDYYKEEEWDGGAMVPPHLILRRRIAGKMAFSVCTGNGRPLKGRALSQVRNTILRMTGFLEA